MTSMLALLMGQMVSPAEVATFKIDAERAIHIGKKALQNLGAQAPLNLATVFAQKHYTNGKRPYWAIGFKEPNGLADSIQIDATDGRVIYASLQPTPAKTSGSLSKPEVERLGLAMARKVGFYKTLKTENVGYGAEGISSVSMPILLNGKPFFNLNPTFQYTVLFHGTRNRAQVFTAFDRLPRIKSAREKVSESAARKILERAIPKTAEFMAQKRPNGNLGSPHLQLTLVKGYYKIFEEPAARTVWCGIAKVYRSTPGIPNPLEVATIRRLVDVETGKVSAIKENDADLVRDKK